MDPLDSERAGQANTRATTDSGGNSDHGSAADAPQKYADLYKKLRSYHRGGKVKETGPANLKKGERVLTKEQQKRMMKKGRGKRSRAKSR
jgi:hypothetical protein